MSSKIRNIQRLIIAFSSLVIIILIIFYPNESLSASIKGLNMWINIVLPALLPFFIVSEIMIELGMVDFLSALLRPIMKPLFNCPGHSSFVWIMSITSGYPMGPKLIASLYQGGSITRMEGQRMLAFCNNSGPLFMIGAVGIGMLGSPEAGKLIAISHILGGLILGILFRFYGKDESKENFRSPTPPSRSTLKGLFTSNTKQNKSLGTILGDSVRNSMQAQLLIGGFIVLFSVIINLFMQNTQTIGFNYGSNNWVFAFPSVSQLVKIIGAGILEITTGCQLLSELMLPIKIKLIFASFIIGWGGFSIHSQAISFLANTDFSMPMYFLSKFLHGVFSALITYILFDFYGSGSIPTFGGTVSGINATMYNSLMSSLRLLGSAFFIFIAIYLLMILVKAIRH